MRGKLLLSAAAFALAAFAGAASAQTATPDAPTADAPAAASPAADVPSNPSAAVRLTPGVPVTGELSPAGEKDWYRLRVRSGKLYNITLTSRVEGDGALDTLVRVVSPSGEELGVNDDSEGTLNSHLQFMPGSSGDVFVEARGFADDAAGGYTLAVTETVLPPDDVRGDSSTHTHIKLGESANGALNFPQDKDWFSINLHEGHTYRFLLNGAGEGDAALADPLLRLIGPGGEEVGRDDDGGDGLNSYLEVTAPKSGEYFLEASAFNEEATGGYVLSAREGDIPDTVETDAVISAEGDSREGTLSPAGDKDWYKLQLAANATVRIAVDSPDQGGIGDPIVAVYDSTGKKIAEDDDGGEGLNSLLEFTAPSAGAYFVEVRGFSDQAEGKYDLTVTSGEIGANPEGADTITPNDEGRSSVLQTPDDVDWFAINMVEGRPYRFNLSGEGDSPLTDPLLTLYDAQGHAVATDDDGGPGLNAYVTYTSVSGGVYYAAVSSFNSAEAGHYHLTASDTDIPGNLDTDETLDGDGDERASVIDLPGDKDYFRVELEQGARYEFTLSGNGDHPLGDPFLALVSSGDEVITSDDDSGPGLDSRILYTAPAHEDGDTSYFLQASGLGGSTGGYNIVVKRLSAPSVHAPTPPETHGE